MHKKALATYILLLERPSEDGIMEKACALFVVRYLIAEVFLLAGRKRKMGASANYAISMDETDFSKGQSYLAKLK